MGVQVNEPWRNDKAVGVEGLLCIAWVEPANFGDFSIFNANVGHLSWITSSIDYRTATNNDIEFRHCCSSSKD
jgi:hypothetical protein